MATLDDLPDAKVSTKDRGTDIEKSFLQKARGRLTKAAVGARFYFIFDIMMEIVRMELGQAESKTFLDMTLKMAVSIGFHVKIGDFKRDTVVEMRKATHDLAMTASHYQKMSMIYDGEYLRSLVDSLSRLMHDDGEKVLDASTHEKIEKVTGFFTMDILDKMFHDDGPYKEPSLRLMELLDTLLAEGRI